jgi:hypothetical protein
MPNKPLSTPTITSEFYLNSINSGYTTNFKSKESDDSNNNPYKSSKDYFESKSRFYDRSYSNLNQSNGYSYGEPPLPPPPSLSSIALNSNINKKLIIENRIDKSNDRGGNVMRRVEPTTTNCNSSNLIEKCSDFNYRSYYHNHHNQYVQPTQSQKFNKNLNNLKNLETELNNNNNNNKTNLKNDYSQQSNKKKDNNDVIDLSGYLIFVTTNRSGCVRVYG